MKKNGKKVKSDHTNQAEVFTRALKKAPNPRYALRLYVTGTTPRSMRAIENLKQICEDNLKGHYALEVIDIYQQPRLAQSQDIVAAPTLIKSLPLPVRRLIGDMANKDRILVGLDLRPQTRPSL